MYFNPTNINKYSSFSEISPIVAEEPYGRISSEILIPEHNCAYKLPKSTQWNALWSLACNTDSHNPTEVKPGGSAARFRVAPCSYNPGDPGPIRHVVDIGKMGLGCKVSDTRKKSSRMWIDHWNECRHRILARNSPRGNLKKFQKENISMDTCQSRSHAIKSTCTHWQHFNYGSR